MLDELSKVQRVCLIVKSSIPISPDHSKLHLFIVLSKQLNTHCHIVTYLFTLTLFYFRPKNKLNKPSFNVHLLYSLEPS